MENTNDNNEFAGASLALQTKPSRWKQIAMPAVLLIAGLGIGGGTMWGLTQKARTDAQLVQATAEAQILNSQAEMNEMAKEMSIIQAEVNRINALGEVLVKKGNVNADNFDFSKPVGQGGGDDDSEDINAQGIKVGLATLKADVAHSGEQLNLLSNIVSKTTNLVKATLAVPLLNTYVTSAFGRRGDPIKGGTQFHKGIDFQAKVGDTVMTVADGVVSFAGWRGGYGNTIEIEHANGYRTRYAHNSRLVAKVGQVVTAGQEIAKAGSTGRSTGPHVHLEVFKNDEIVNPLTFLNKKPTNS